MFKKLSTIVFVLAFVAGGWSTALAAALCDHWECTGRPAAKESHAARVSEEPSEEHCSKGIEQSEHGVHEAAADVSAEGPSGHSLRGTGGHARSCIHCVGAPAAPAGNGSGVPHSQTRVGAEAAAPLVTKVSILPEVAIFPALRPTQGSPPTPARRRHLLNHVFLI